mmetsp:Transcript_7696/g.7577  ORF Transcript_7696/g.7577 Transcript_7696/m.7577 type:complete len:177 (-) Transcript_7696:176-706(-)
MSPLNNIPYRTNNYVDDASSNYLESHTLEPSVTPPSPTTPTIPIPSPPHEAFLRLSYFYNDNDTNNEGRNDDPTQMYSAMLFVLYSTCAMIAVLVLFGCCFYLSYAQYTQRHKRRRQKSISRMVASLSSASRLARINGHLTILNEETGEFEYIGDTHSVATTVVVVDENDDFQEGL